MASSFKFSLGGVDHKLGRFDNKVERAAVAVMGFYAPKAETWMKHKAPWKDRTTNARNGLFAMPFHRGNTAGIILAHSVDYGIYLELPTKHSKKTYLSKAGLEVKGAYPIIIPAMEHWGPRVMKKMTRLIDRMGK